MEWTPEQQQCINTVGGSLTVSAAAGSGKTSVLVERVLHRVTAAEDPLDLDRLLVVTFTRAAAAEMKQRLSKKLRETLREDPANTRLRRQQALLPLAQISTIDSFCAALVKEHFHALDISPRFVQADEVQTRELQEKALREILEEAYETADPVFERLCTLLCGNQRDNEALKQCLLELYLFSEAYPFPEQWLQQAQAAYDTAVPISQIEPVKWVRQYLQKQLDQHFPLLTQMRELCRTHAPTEQRYGGFIDDRIREAAALREHMQNGSWDEMRQYAAVCTEAPTLPKITKEVDPAIKDELSSRWKRFQDNVLSPCGSLMTDSEADLIADREAQAPLVRCLCELVQRFSARYTAKKRERRMLDFSDLEHLALRLLVTLRPDGSPEKTPLAVELSEHFDEIMVDEYQDTNRLQDTLFAALSRDENNLFVVGDIKQSIYGFRQAMPELLRDRREGKTVFSGEPHRHTPLMLGSNFRSRSAVTDSVNFLFRQLMTRSMGGVAYADREELVCGTAYPDPDDPAYNTELILVDQSDIDRAEDETDRMEARSIARRIRELHGTLMITNKGEDPRPAQYRDFCILLRGIKRHAGAYVAELENAGIPTWTPLNRGLFETREAAVALSLLRVINNPRLDVPLLSVLCSPVGGFVPDELVQLRPNKATRQLPLYAALLRMGKEDTPLGQRCRAFTQQIDRFRTWAVTLPADRLLIRVLEETDLPALVSALPGGEARAAHLRELTDIARRFEDDGFRGLAAFLRYIDRMIENPPSKKAATMPEHLDAVRILTVHNAKGLEYPVVFVARLGGQINTQDAKATVLCHAGTGIGLMQLDPDTGCYYSPLTRNFIQQKLLEEARAEELRVLYVAVTRAREKLILVASVGDTDKALSGAAVKLPPEAVPFPAEVVGNADSMAKWILMAAMRHPDAALLRERVNAETAVLYPTKSHWDFRLEAGLMPGDVEKAEEAAASPYVPDEDRIARLRERFAYRYPYEALALVPAKRAASALSHEETGAAFVAHARPAFMGKQGLSPTERGTALHALLEHWPLSVPAAEPETAAASLVAAGFLTKQQADSLPLPALRAFFADPLYARMAASPRCEREYPFSMELPLSQLAPDTAAALPPDAAGETVLIQGIIDCAFEEDGGWILLDYKTDRVDTPATLIERYHAQLRLYRQALETATGMPVHACYLYSFSLRQAVQLSEQELTL